MTALFGLTDSDLSILISTVKKYPEIEEAIIFGSRAKGNYKRGSDIDIALKGKNIDDVLWKVSDYLEEETLMPYHFDILNYNTISSMELKEHIDRVGISIYKNVV